MIDTDLDYFLRTNPGSFAFLPRPLGTTPRLPMESFKRKIILLNGVSSISPLHFLPSGEYRALLYCWAPGPAATLCVLPPPGALFLPEAQNPILTASIETNSFLMERDLIQMLNSWTFHRSSNYSSVTPHRSLKERKCFEDTSSKGSLFTTGQDFGYMVLSTWWTNFTMAGTVPLVSHLSFHFQEASDPDMAQSYHSRDEEGHGKINPWKVLLGIPGWGLLPCKEQPRADLVSTTRETSSQREKPLKRVERGQRPNDPYFRTSFYFLCTLK